MRLSHHASLHSKLAPHVEHNPQRLRETFEALGPTFVKLGQILSTRPDIVGEKLADEFKRLQDHVEPFDSAVARQIIESELKQPIPEIFSSFDDQPAG